MKDQDPIQKVGYWNGSTDDPVVVFSPPTEENWELVVVTIKPLPRQDVPGYGINEATKLRKVNRELRNLVTSTRRLK